VGSNAEAAANAFDELSKKLKQNAEERRKEMMINSLCPSTSVNDNFTKKK
jgi:hypothetical protein